MKCIYNNSAVVEMGNLLATTDMGRKAGGTVVHLSVVRLVPHLTQCGLGQGLPPYQVAPSSIQPFGHNRHRPKMGRCAPFFFGGWSWVPI